MKAILLYSEMLENMAISLLEAIRNGDQSTAKWILRHKRYSDLDKQSPKKDGTSLFWCCCKGYVELVHLLLLHGADINKCTAWGAAPLHASADHNNVEILVLLVEFGANVNQQTTNGDTACHLAAYRGYKDCVQRLADWGANVGIRNNKRHTPIQEAYARGHYDIYSYLLNVQKLVTNPKAKPKQKSESMELGRTLSAPRPSSENYKRESLRDTGNYNGSTCTVPTDYTSVINGESNSNLPRPYRSPVKTNVLGVLRVNHGNISRGDLDLVNDISTNNSSMNDLSSMNTSSMVSSVPSMLSFKNI